MNNNDECCCGHWRTRHPYGGACKDCGGISCPKFHDVGEGHGRVTLLLLMLAASVLWGAWACWRVRQRRDPELRAIRVVRIDISSITIRGVQPQ